MAQNSQAYQHYIHDVPVDPGFPRDFKFILVESIEQLRELLSEPVNLFGFDIETTGLNSETDDIVSFSFCKESHVGYNVPVDHDPIVNGGNPGLGEEALDLVYEFMRDKARWVAIHNFAFESRMMEWHGFTSLDDYHKRMWLGLEPYVENEFFTQDQVSHCFKYDMGKINYFDTMVSCWLSDTNDQKTGLKKYEEKFLGWRSSSFEDTLGDNVNFKFTNYRDPSIIEYTCLDAIGAYNLAVKTKRFYDEAKTSGKIDMKFIYTIMRCSTLLQRLDPVVLKNYEDELSEHLYKLEQECWSIAGQPFNLKSPKDKARIFELLGLNTGEVGKAGVMKTGKELLNKLKKSLDKSDPNYKLLDNITQFGILSTVKNTFVKNLLNACESGGYRENFTRFNYKTTHVPTGRLSAAGDKKSLGFFSDLNIQNIPKPHPADYHAISIQDAMRLNPELVELGRGDEPGTFKDVWYYQTSKRNCKIVRIMGWLFTQVYWKNVVVDADGHIEKWPDDFPFNNEFENPMIEEGADQHLNIRSAMLPFDDDDYILSLDYSGQELKAAAMLSREPVWFDAFANGDDAHKQTAYAIFGKENYDKEKRKLAKGLNFGIIYGMEAYSIYSRGMAKTPEEAEDFYTKFKDGLPVLFNWLDSVVQDGKTNGTVYTMFGRPRRVKYWLDNDNFKFKAFGARTCKNTVVQGTGADITKTALNRVFDNVLNVPKNKTIVRFMSTVHDEVNYSVKKKYFSSVAKTINKLMTIWIGSNDRFPFDTGLGIGLRWGELFDFDYDKKTFDILHPKWDPLPPKPVEYVVDNSEEEVVEEITYDFSKMFEGLDEEGSNEF